MVDCITKTSTTASSVPNNFIEILTAQGKIVGAVMKIAVVLFMEQLGVFFVVRLLQLVRGSNTMAVETVASRGEFVKAARARLSRMVATAWLGTFRRHINRSGRGSLNIAGIGIHRDTLANLGDAVSIFDVYL